MKLSHSPLVLGPALDPLLALLKQVVRLLASTASAPLTYADILSNLYQISGEEQKNQKEQVC